MTMKKFFLITAVFLTVISCTKHEGVVKEGDIPMFAQKTNAKLNDGNIELVAWMTEPSKPRHGESFKIFTYWKFKEQLPEGWKIFYHFENETGEERFVHDNEFLGGRVKKLALNKVIKEETEIKELPRHFDTDSMYIRTGFFKEKERTIPEDKYNDGQNRLNLGPLEITQPNILRKRMDVYAVAGRSRNQIEIDGEFKESFWENASKDDKFWQSRGNDLAKIKTTVMTVMDDKYLYVGFDVEDKDIYAEYKNDDDPIYEKDDVVEIFIDPRGEGKIYYEIQVSAAGVKFDTKFNGRRKNRDDLWDSKIKYAVKIDGTLNDPGDEDKGWSAEIAIPWESIEDSPDIPPKDGQTWKVFFYRINRYSDKKSQSSDFTAWTPPYSGDFHNLKYMGELHFVYEEIL
jgi:hypothetical protein